MSKPFADVIRDYRNGALHDKLTGELAQAVQRAVEHCGVPVFVGVPAGK